MSNERVYWRTFECSKCGYKSNNPDDFTTTDNKYICFQCYYEKAFDITVNIRVMAKTKVEAIRTVQKLLNLYRNIFDVDCTIVEEL